MIKFENKNLFLKLEKKFKKVKNYDELKKKYLIFLNNFDKLNKNYKFSITTNKKYIDEQLKNIDYKKKGLFFGIPFGIKDIFNTKSLKTEFGSVLYKNFFPGNNSRLVDIILNKQGIITCKTTTAEFAVHHFPEKKTINPFNKNHITGTSSAGSAVAVACGALPVALATQTAGSIIRPASFCGTIGFKPSFGALDRTGILKTTDTLDTVGLFATDFYGLKKTFKNLIQYSEEYPFSKKFFIKRKKKKIKISIISDVFKQYKFYDESIKDEFNIFCENYLKNLDLMDSKKFQFINDAHVNHENIYTKSLAYYFKRIANKKKNISSIMQHMIDSGNKIKKKEYLKSFHIQKTLTNKFDNIMKNCDFLIMPSTASVAPKIGLKEKEDASLIWTFFGAPSISLPIFYDNKLKLPFGLQIVARRYNDFLLLDFAEKITQKITQSNEK